MAKHRMTAFYNEKVADDAAEGIYEVTPTLEEWKRMQQGENIESPLVVEK